MTNFATKLDYSNNRQIKQYLLTNTALSGKTTIGIPDSLIPISSANTINLDALQYVQARGYILATNPITVYTGVTSFLTRNTDGVIVNAPTSGFTGGAGSGSTDNDYVSSAGFNTSDGVLTLTRVSGGTVTVDLDDRYSLTGHTHTLSGLTDTLLTGVTHGYVITYNSGTTKWEASESTGGINTDDYLTGGTFSTSTGDLDLVRQSGDTVTVNLDGRYGITNQQKNINGNYTILSGDNNTLLVLSSATAFNITVNSGLTNNFETEFINIGTSTVTFLTSGTANLTYPDGTIFLPNKVAFLVKIGSTNNYWLKGELE